VIWGQARATAPKIRYHIHGEAKRPPRLYVTGHHPGWPRAFLVGVLVLVLAGTAACSRRTPALSRVQASGTLRVAIDPSFPPFESVDSSGHIVGYDADLAKALARRLAVDVHFVTTGYDALYDALTAGRADVVISALYPDQSRTAGFAFSDPYFNAGEIILVDAGSSIATPDDLAGKSVACIFGTAGHMELLQLVEVIRPVPAVITVDDPVTITALLHSGTADAIITDHVSALIATAGDPDVRILMPPLTDEPYVIAARREDAKLLRALDDALSELAAGGTLDELRNRWMGEPADR